MNFIVSLALAAFMASASTPTNPVLQGFLQEVATEAEKAGIANPCSYEETFLGPAIIMTQEVPVTGDQLDQIPADMVKPQMVQELKNDPESKEFIQALIETNTLFIMRMKATDGKTVDFIITSADLK